MTPLNSEASATNFETRNAANAAIDELPASAGHADPAAIQASRAGSRVDKRQSVPETKAQLGGMASSSPWTDFEVNTTLQVQHLGIMNQPLLVLAAE